MESLGHKCSVYSVVREYEIKGYSVKNDELNNFYSRLSSLGWRPDFVVSNNEEIVIIEVVYSTDRCKPELIDSIQPFFDRKIRLDKRRYWKGKRRQTSMDSNMETKTSLNRPGSPSLKSTIPQGVVVALKIGPGDSLKWSIEARDGKIIAIIEKTG